MMALTFTALGFGYLILLLFVTVPPENSGSINIITGGVLAILGGIATYYFGSSKDKSDQDKANNPNMQTGATVDTKTTIEATKPAEKTV